MVAYAIIQVDVHDSETFKQYQAEVPAIIKQWTLSRSRRHTGSVMRYLANRAHGGARVPNPGPGT